jgi:hypothetical protein
MLMVAVQKPRCRQLWVELCGPSQLVVALALVMLSLELSKVSNCYKNLRVLIAALFGQQQPERVDEIRPSSSLILADFKFQVGLHDNRDNIVIAIFYFYDIDILSPR